LQNSANVVAGGLPFLDKDARGARRLRRPAIRLEAMWRAVGRFGLDVGEGSYELGQAQQGEEKCVFC